MLKQKAITMIVAGSLAIVAVSGTAFAAKSAVDKKEAETTTAVTTTAENTTEPASENATQAEAKTTTQEKTTAEPLTKAIPSTNANGEVVTKSPEELEAEYQIEYRRLTESYEHEMAKTKLTEMPEPPSEDATSEEIEKYNKRVDEVEYANKKTQWTIDMYTNNYNKGLEELNRKYGK